MGKILLPVLTVLLLAPAASGQYGTWTLLPSSPRGAQNGRHEDISFPTPELGYLVNFNGELHRTINGGDSWELIQVVETLSEDPVRLRSVGFVDENKGWIGALTGGYVLWQTDDGALIYVVYSGRLVVPAIVADAFRDPQAIGSLDSSSYYFRVCPLFETSAERYSWLNEIVAVGIGRRTGGGVVYRLFQVE